MPTGLNKKWQFDQMLNCIKWKLDQPTDQKTSEKITTESNYNWIKLQLNQITTRLNYNWIKLQLNQMTSESNYNWIKWQVNDNNSEVFGRTFKIQISWPLNMLHVSQISVFHIKQFSFRKKIVKRKLLRVRIIVFYSILQG